MVEINEQPPLRDEVAAAGSGGEAGTARQPVSRGRGRHQARARERDPHRESEQGDAIRRTSSWSSSRRAACGCGSRRRTSRSSRNTPEDLQAGGDRPGLHERERLGPPRREAGQHPGERDRATRRSSTSPSPRRSRPGLRSWFYRQGKAQGTPSYMSPGADPRRVAGRPGRHLQFWGARVRTDDRPAAVPRHSIRTCSIKHFTRKAARPTAHNPDVTDEFSALILKMLAKKKTDRPANFHEVLIELRKMKQIFKSVPRSRSKSDGRSAVSRALVRDRQLARGAIAMPDPAAVRDRISTIWRSSLARLEHGRRRPVRSEAMRRMRRELAALRTKKYTNLAPGRRCWSPGTRNGRRRWTTST